MAHLDLLHIPGFGGCSPKQLAHIDRLTDRTTVLPGQELVREGTIGHELYIIVSGMATVSRGGRQVATLGPGDYFGELAAIATDRRNATLTAVTTLSVLIIGPRQFTTLMADVRGFRDALLRGMAKRLRAADRTIDQMVTTCRDIPLAEVRPITSKVSISSPH
jgi:CRP-like cAMP-binding protein